MRPEQRIDRRATGRRLLAVLGLVILAAGGGAWAAPDQAEVGETIRRTTEQLRSTGEVIVAGRKLRSAKALPEIYEARGFQLLWQSRSNMDAMLGEIAAASGDGLNPADYHFAALREALEVRRQDPDNPMAAAQADLLLTDALVRLATHFHFGKVDAATGRARWDLEGTIRGESAVALVARIAAGNSLALQLGELRPVQPLYGLFKSALARYRVIEQQGGWAPIAPGRVLQAGMEDARVLQLRRRLAMTGDFGGDVEESLRFEPALEEAVRRFQARHHLDIDGRLGPATLRSLNRPVGERIAQLRANLERARWLLGEVRGRFLVVDAAGRRIVLMANSRPVLEQGASFAAAARSAGEFRAQMRYFVVNPDWVLPPELVETQVAPLARRDPAQLKAHGLQVLDAAGQAVDPVTADWSRPTTLTVRQLPGPGSFLGELRFAVSGEPQLSLHGGPAAVGALPGSIRIEDPVALARALSGPPATWTLDDLATALTADAGTTMPLGRPVPVLFGSWSAWVHVNGTVYFRPGQDERDATIIAGLRRGADGG